MAGAVNITFGAIVSGFVSGISQATAAVSQFSRELNSNLSASYAAADRQQRVFDRGVGKLSGSLLSVGRQASVFSASIALIGASSFKTYSDINALQLGLENITGSAAAATARFNELLPVVRLPGLGLEEAIKGDVRLQAVGFSAKQSKDALLQFGNALALTGGGKFELDSVLTQLTQMGSKAKVLSEDLKPILTSSPAVAKAIKQMFGTVDSEQISAKLEAAGRSPVDFINDLILKLSQLERVKGGPKNALENLGDSLKLAQFNLGQAADKAFGLTTILDKVGNAATGLADKFSNLSPTTQKTILVVTGLVAAIGPLALALGGLLALVPSIIAGSAALTVALGVSIGPIIAIGAAVVGAAALIIFNWDSIKKVLTDTGIWQTVTDLASSAFGLFKSIVSVTVGFVQEVWARFGGAFVAIGKTAFEGIIAVFKFGAGVIQGALKVLTGVLNADWRTGLDGLLDIAKSILNLLVDAFKFVAAGIGRAIAAVFQQFGATSLADKITSGIDKALSKLDTLKFSLQSVGAAAGKIKLKPLVIPGVGDGKKTEKPFDYLGIDLSGSALKKAKDRLKELKDQIGSGKLAGKDVSALQTEYDNLKASIDKATASTTAHKVASESQAVALTTNERILKRLTRQLKEYGDVTLAGDKTSLAQQVQALQDQVARDKQLKPVEIKAELIPTFDPSRLNSIISGGGITTAGIGNRSPTLGLPYITQFQTHVSEQLRDAGLKLDEDKKALAFNIGRIPLALGSVRDEMNNLIATDPMNARGVISTLLASTQEIKAAIEAARSTLVSGGIDLLEGLGEGLASGKASLKSTLVSVIGLLADYVSSIGRALIITGIPLALAGGIFGGLGVKQILTGGALVLAAGLAKGLAATAFAQGGLVYGPTLGMVGEGRGTTRSNPEVIAPLDKLKNFMPRGGGSQVIIPDVVIDGSKLRIVMNRANDDFNQYR